MLAQGQGEEFQLKVICQARRDSSVMCLPYKHEDPEPMLKSLGMMTCACNPSAVEADKQIPGVAGQPALPNQ